MMTTSLLLLDSVRPYETSEINKGTLSQKRSETIQNYGRKTITSHARFAKMKEQLGNQNEETVASGGCGGYTTSETESLTSC